MYLNSHTHYSFKYGSMSPSNLIEEALKHGIRDFALTDINSTSGCLQFARTAQNSDLKVVLGVDFRKGVEQQFVALARSHKGYEEINHLLSDILCRRRDQPSRAPQMQDVLIIYPLNNCPPLPLHKNEFIGISQEDLLSFRLKKIQHWPLSHCVALNTVSFRNKRDYNAHALLRAIDNNTLLSKLKETERGKIHHGFYSASDLKMLYSGSEFLLQNAQKLLDQCQIEFDFNNKANPQNQRVFSSSEEEDLRLLYQLAEEGLQYRFGTGITDQVRERLNKEMQVIRDCRFVSYFLINHAIVSYARSKGYFYVGRGSGANSLVAYLLKITNVDPIELDLYFERFINPSRKSPPDFDVDFSWKDREDVTRFIFERFPHTALLGSYVTFQQQSVIREIGKVLGVPDQEISSIQRARTYTDLDHLGRLCLRYSQYISGLPNHLSVHSSGIIITDKPIQYFSAVSLPPKGFPTCHFDMHIAEDAGIYKLDILGQRGLGKIKDSLEIIRLNHPDAEEIDIDDINRFKKDERVKDLLRTARSIGCFYIESPAMRALMKKLKVDDYKGLVAASSIIRPGVSKSGMMQEYVRRHRDPERKAAVHPVLWNLLKETYGVMVYQEDVLRVAHYFAGLSLEESDTLRRGMSWKFRERPEFHHVKQQFFMNCRKKGYPLKLTEEIWTQIESFANYAFAKGHSASYAVESYQSLFLKAYYPLEYMVATVNNFGGFYHTEHYLQEARLLGARIIAPCVNCSENLTHIRGRDIILGFQHIKNLEQQITRSILKSRLDYGPFENLQDFVQRISIKLEMLVILIRVNAFRFTGKEKGTLLWEAHFLLGERKQSKAIPQLFKQVQGSRPKIPALEKIPNEDAYDELEYLGFTLCSPFELIEESELDSTSCLRDFDRHIGETITVVGYLVHVKKTTAKGKHSEQTMAFGTFMDQEGFFLDTVHFPDSLNKYRFTGRGVYKIRGKVSSDFGHTSLEASFMEKLVYTKLMNKP